MKFVETEINGCFLIDLEPVTDSRGHFVRTYCESEFSKNGINAKFVQCNSSLNTKRLTLRGLHYTSSPSVESKLIRCTRGKVFDVLVDLRRESSTFLSWVSFELSADIPKMIYVPPRIAHGYLSLDDDSELFYQMTESYKPEYSKGIRYDDPRLNIKWPSAPKVMSDKDSNLPLVSDVF